MDRRRRARPRRPMTKIGSVRLRAVRAAISRRRGATTPIGRPGEIATAAPAWTDNRARRGTKISIVPRRGNDWEAPAKTGSRNVAHDGESLEWVFRTEAILK